MDIYGQYKDSLEAVMRMMAASIEWYAKAHKDDSGELIYEHLRYRLKSEKSMQAKLEVRGLPLPLIRRSARCGMPSGSVLFAALSTIFTKIFHELKTCRESPW